jgi:hypothetical protein
MNVLHYEVIASIGEGTTSESTFVANLSTKLAVIYKAILPSTSRYEGIQVVREILPPPAATTSNAGASAGLLIGDALAPQLSPLASLRSAGAPSRTRGRIYFPSGGEVDEGADGRLTVTSINAYNNVVASLAQITSINSGGLTEATIALRIKKGQGALATYHAVTDWLIRSSFATQRRRSLINRGDVNPF